MRPWHNWPGFKEFAHRLLGKTRSDIYDVEIQMAQEQVVLQPTNRSRDRRPSLGFATIEQLMQHSSNPTPRGSRAQSEEPEEKKRKHFRVDVEELMMIAEERVLSARRVKSADKKFKEATSVYSPVLGPEQRVYSWSVCKDEVKEERLPATSDAPRLSPHERGPFKTIRELRDEHEKKQREEIAAYERQISQVKKTPQTDSMGKPRGGGIQPVNRLNTTNQSHEQDSRKWIKPKANSSAGLAVSQVAQATSQNSNKRQRVGESTHAHTYTVPHSPDDLEHDVSYSQRRGSAARSGNSQMLNEQGRSTSGSGLAIKEYQNVLEITKPRGINKRTRPGHSSSGYANGAAAPKLTQSTVVRLGEGEGEDPDDPIIDSDGDAMNKPTSKKRMVPRVELDNYRPEGARSGLVGKDKSLMNANGAQPRINGRSTSSLETPAISPHFQASGKDHQESKPQVGRQAGQIASTGRKLQPKRRSGEGFSTRPPQDSNEDSCDELLDSSQKVPAERPHPEAFKTAQKLLEMHRSDPQTLSDQGGSINVDDSDEDSSLKVPDIKPTKFRSVAKATKSTAKYEIIQLFSHEKLRLRDSDNKTWTMDHQGEKNVLLLYNEKGESEGMLLTKPFDGIQHDAHDDTATKVIILRHRNHQASSATHLYVEFSTPRQCLNFTESIIHGGAKSLQKDSKWLGKAFTKFLVDFSKEKPPNDQAKQPRDEAPADIQLAMAKSQKRHAEKWDEVQSSKRARLDESNGLQTKTNNEAAPRSRRSMAEGMKADSMQVDDYEDTRRSFQHHQLEPSAFYGTSSSEVRDTSLSHGTRSSTRNSGAGALRTLRPQLRSPSPEIPELWTKLNPGWVKDHNWQGSLVYPPQGNNRATVDAQDIYRLDEGEFLNDNLVTFYLRWLENRLEAERPEIAKRVRFFNSFFYEKLKQPVKGSEGGINYKAVEKWTNKVKLFEYDYIVVPVNENLHWYVAIICNAPKLLEDAIKAKNDEEIGDEANGKDSGAAPGNSNEASQLSDSGLTPRTRGMTLADKKAKESEQNKPLSDTSSGQNAALVVESNGVESHVGDSLPPPIVSDIIPETKTTSAKKGKKKSAQNSRKSPSEFRIITLDSFHTGRATCCTKLKRYLLQEMKSKLGIEGEDPGTRGMTAKNIPFQSNHSDCGLFLLSYIEKFLQDPDEFIRDILLNEAIVDLAGYESKYPPPSSMRERVRDLLFELQKEQYDDKDLGKGEIKSTTKSQKTPDIISATGPLINSHPMEVPPILSAELYSRADREEAEGGKTNSDGQVQAKTATDFPEPATAQASKIMASQISADLIEPTPKQGGTITQLWENVTGLFRSSATSTPDIAPSAQVPHDKDYIENDVSSYNNGQVLETIEGRVLEIGDSQARSSQASFVARDASSLHNANTSNEPILISDSPVQTRSTPKSIPSTTNNTRKHKSSSPRPTMNGRISKSAAPITKKSTNILKSPSPRPLSKRRVSPTEQFQAALAGVPQLGSPSPEPEDPEGAVDLLKPFTPESSTSHEEVNGQNGNDTMDGEMLLPNGDRGVQSFSNYLETSQSPTSTPTGKPLKNQHITGTGDRDVEETSAPLARGKKRKSPDDDQGHSVQPQRRKGDDRGRSAEIPIEIDSPQEDDKAEGGERAADHRSERRIVEHSYDYHAAMSKGTKSKKQKSAAEIIDGEQRPSLGFQLDSSDAAIIGSRRPTHTRFTT